MNFKRILRESIVSILIISLFWASYAALSGLKATQWEALTTAKWNALVDAAVPTWFVWSFNLSTCPTGWSAADGTNGNPDLRWEFIRGLDGGRWIDTGRILASWQISTSIHNDVVQAVHPVLSNTDGAGPTKTVNRWAWQAGWNTTSTSKTLRPRNVALLYCIKN